MFNKKLMAVVVLVAVVCAVPSWGATFKAVKDSQFLDICVGGSEQEIINAINSGANVNAKDRNGKTALMIVASKWHKEAVNVMLKAGADVHARNNEGATVLMFVSSPEIAETLIQAGADVNAKDRSGGTAIMGAAANNLTELVNLLLKYGADVNIKAEYYGDYTALINAANIGSTEIVKALLKAGANVNAKTNFAATALIEGAHQSVELIHALLRAGADVNAKNIFGVTALMGAAKWGRNENVDILIEAGANDEADNDGKTALIYASGSDLGNVEATVNALIEAGSNVKHRYNSGKTALDYARDNDKLKGTDALKRLEELSR